MPPSILTISSTGCGWVEECLTALARLGGKLRRWGPWILCWAAWGASALADAPREYQLKSVLLLRLAQFTEWPTDAFAHPDSPLIIAVLGDNPFGDALKLAIVGERAHGHPIVDRSIHDLSEARACHVLYIAESNHEKVARIIASLDHRSILTVSSLDGFATRDGGMVRFAMEQGKVKIQVNLGRLDNSHLVIDARVLRAVEVVQEK